MKIRTPDWLRRSSFAAGGIALISVLLYGLIRAGLFLGGQPIGQDVKLPLLAIAGVIALLMALAVVGITFASVELSDKTQALALPEGSIRAVIALCLVVLFAIISVSLYSTLSDTPVRKVAGLTVEEKDAFLRDTLRVKPLATGTDTVNGKVSYTVDYWLAPSRASEDFAKQLLILVGTLVTAVASFYFGTRATAAAPETPKPPTLAGVTPDTVTAGSTTPLALSGSNLLLVTDVLFTHGGDKLNATDVTSSDSQVKCSLKTDPSTPKGKWDAIVTDSGGQTARRDAVLSVI